MRFSSLASIAASVACASALGCTDLFRPRDVHPMAGTYDVTTTMDSAYFRGPCSGPSGPATVYCSLPTLANGMASLSGVITIGETFVTPSDGSPRYLTLNAVFITQDCVGSSDTGCTSKGQLRTRDWVGKLTEADMATTPMYVYVQPTTSTYPTGILLNSTFDGDSLYGRTGFATESQSGFTGPFVARRRR
jgi:hypothetical protein